MINHFREASRSSRNTTVHNIEQEPDLCNVEEDHSDTVDTDLIIFNSKWLAVIVNLKTSSSQVSMMIPYQVDTDSDGNIIPLHLHIKNIS